MTIINVSKLVSSNFSVQELLSHNKMPNDEIRYRRIILILCLELSGVFIYYLLI